MLMEIVIKIDDYIAQGIIDGEKDAPRNIVRAFQATIADAIKNGTPLHPNGNWTRRHYINGDKTLDMWVCSRCGEEFSYDAETGASIYDYDYCPNCGDYKRNRAEGDIE